MRDYTHENILVNSKEIAKRHNVDLAIPNCKGSGIANALVYTRLVEEYSLRKGKPIKILTGPLQPSIGTINNEDPFAIWRNNPYIHSIKNGQEFQTSDLELVNKDRHSLVQLNHIIENICWAYGIRPRELRCSLFLSKKEMSWALNSLKKLQRPLICLHPGGNTKSLPSSPWYKDNWLKIIERMKDFAGFFQAGSVELGDCDLGLMNPGKYLREMMALIWASDIFIGFDSCPMHIATAFRKPVITIFDMRRKFEAEGKYSPLYIPSVMLRWAYPFNRNIAVMENDSRSESLNLVVDTVKQHLDKLAYYV